MWQLVTLMFELLTVASIQIELYQNRIVLVLILVHRVWLIWRLTRVTGSKVISRWNSGDDGLSWPRCLVRRKPLFRYHPPFRPKISGCSPWSRSVMLMSADSEHHRLTNCEIIFEDFQRMWSRCVYVTDRLTDGRTICRSNTTLRSIARYISTMPTTTLADNTG